MRDHSQTKFVYGETLSPDAPRPNQTVFEIISSHLALDKDNSGTHLALNDVYKSIGSSEREVEKRLDILEQQGAISREDNLVLLVLLAVSRTLGPDLEFLRQAILYADFNPAELSSKIAASGLDKQIIEFLYKITQSLKK
jgi:hypothetical protein